MRSIAIASLGLGLAWACKPAAFTCDIDLECRRGDEHGTCEPTNYCSFPAPECPSHRRYGDLAADDVAGDCVDGEAASGTATTGGSGSDTGGSVSSGGLETGIVEGDPYGACTVSQDCPNPGSICVTNGTDRMCAPTCTSEASPSSECPAAVGGGGEVSCLFTDADQTMVRCFITCQDDAQCPNGMVCAAPVCTWQTPM